jgi:cytochrome P450
MIGNTVFALLQHPDQLRCLQEEPALSRGAIEECLRFESPVRLGARTAMADIPLRGRLIRAGDVVLALFAAANRDPARFAHPDRLDVRRHDNRHFAFGHGIHFCLGHALARLEGEVFLDRFVRRMSKVELCSGPSDPLWNDSLPFRGLRALPICFHAG